MKKAILVLNGVSLNKSEIEYISVTDKNDIDISFAFNDKYKEIVNIYKLYENILNLQNRFYYWDLFQLVP